MRIVAVGNGILRIVNDGVNSHLCQMNWMGYLRGNRIGVATIVSSVNDYIVRSSFIYND